MREIKFRAWNPYHKRMMLERTLYELTNDTWPSQCYDHVMQFTGLKDKNGKEIYEGDLVKLATGAGLFEIMFENGCWSYISGPGSYTWILYEHVRPGCDYLNLEVIGNIYENPELLK